MGVDLPGRRRTGGASRDRTDDPLLAKQVLSQLSYGPVTGRKGVHRRTVGSAAFWMQVSCVGVLRDGQVAL